MNLFRCSICAGSTRLCGTRLLEAITGVCDSAGLHSRAGGGGVRGSAAASAVPPSPLDAQAGQTRCGWRLAAAGIGSSTGSEGSPERPDAVLTTPFSFFASASAMLRAGARPVFADIDGRTFNLSCGGHQEGVERCRGPWGSGNYAGPPVWPVRDMDTLTALAAEAGIVVVEDAAQAFGARWNGQPAGSLGVAAAFSFYPTKNLAAMGDAGLVTTSDAGIAARMRSLRTHGMTRRYYHDEVGWNARMDGIQAAVLQVKLRHVEAWGRERRRVAERYDALFRTAGLAGDTVADGVVLPWRIPGRGMSSINTSCARHDVMT